MKNLKQAILWKLRKLKLSASTLETNASNEADSDEQLTAWQVDGMDAPNQEILSEWCDEYESTGKFEVSFSFDKFLSDCEFNLDATAKANLMPYVGGAKAYTDSLNFSGLKASMNGLVQLGKINASDRDALFSVLLIQGINLNN